MHEIFANFTSSVKITKLNTATESHAPVTHSTMTLATRLIDRYHKQWFVQTSDNQLGSTVYLSQHCSTLTCQLIIDGHIQSLNTVVTAQPTHYTSTLNTVYIHLSVYTVYTTNMYECTLHHIQQNVHSIITCAETINAIRFSLVSQYTAT